MPSSARARRPSRPRMPCLVRSRFASWRPASSIARGPSLSCTLLLEARGFSDPLARPAGLPYGFDFMSDPHDDPADPPTPTRLRRVGWLERLLGGFRSPAPPVANHAH